MRLALLFLFLPLLAFSQPVQRQFFTTNTDPRVTIVAGTNAFITASTPLPNVRQFLIDVPSIGGSGQTNLALVVAGTNATVVASTNLGVTTFTVSSTAPGSGQTNLTLIVAGTNVFVTSATNLGVTTFTIDGPALRATWSVGDITNAGTLAYSNVAVLIGATNTATLQTQLGLGTAAYSNTAAFLLKSGDTSTGPQLTTSSTTNAPAANEFVTGAWVRGLLNEGFFEYASTNIISGTNADSPNQFLYAFHMGHIPDSATRVWTSAFLTNGGYIGSVSTTNTFQSIAGQILVNAYIGLSSGGGDALSLKPEIYLSTDRSNWYGDFDCSAQAITPGVTQLYSFAVSFPAQTATNPAGFFIERRLKVTSKGGSPTMYFLVGTNTISGTNSASHISINAAPVQGGTFSGVFVGNGYGLTNIPQSAVSNAPVTIYQNSTNLVIDMTTSSYQLLTATNDLYITAANITPGASVLIDITAGTTNRNIAFDSNFVWMSFVNTSIISNHVMWINLLASSANTNGIRATAMQSP